MDSINPNASLNVKEDESQQEVQGNLTNAKSETFKGTKSKKSKRLETEAKLGPILVGCKIRVKPPLQLQKKKRGIGYGLEVMEM